MHRKFLDQKAKTKRKREISASRTYLKVDTRESTKKRTIDSRATGRIYVQFSYTYRSLVSINTTYTSLQILNVKWG